MQLMIFSLKNSDSPFLHLPSIVDTELMLGLRSASFSCPLVEGVMCTYWLLSGSKYSLWKRCTQSFTVTVWQFINLCTPLDLRFPFSTIYSFPSLPQFFFLCQKGHCCNSLSGGHLCKPGVSLLLEVVVEAPESVPVESVCQIFVKTFPVALQIVQEISVTAVLEYQVNRSCGFQTNKQS